MDVVVNRRYVLVELTDPTTPFHRGNTVDEVVAALGGRRRLHEDGFRCAEILVSDIHLPLDELDWR